ncbi:Ina1p RNJ42_03266 [Nakaseomyces bracarensis]|uniref:Ina1p n=1 Tax=Nakaseomyces bracarensis TaxID=273131 RepID=UPI00387215B0
MKFEKLLFTVTAVFALTTFLLFIIATAGSSSNYKPITNIKIGEADISHINVTKVVPQIGPILTILGSALTANASLEQVFDALKMIAETPALTPLLSLLSNSKTNVTGTVESLTYLAPLALKGTDATTDNALSGINSIISDATNVSAILEGLESVVQSSVDSITSPNFKNMTILENKVFALLLDSSNVTASTEALINLNQISDEDKQKLIPSFTLFSESSNLTGTIDAMASLMNYSSALASIPTAELQTLFATVSSLASSKSSLISTITALSGQLPSTLAPAVSALTGLLNDTSDDGLNSTLNALQTLLLKNNITASVDAAKISIESIKTMNNYANNKTLLINNVEDLASQTSVPSNVTTAQLVALDDIFSGSGNASESLRTLMSLQTGLMSAPSLLQYIPYLFELLAGSDNATVTFTSLLELTNWAKNNTATFTPIVSILSKANSITPVTAEQLREMTPSLLQYLHIPLKFHLSIFTLCKANINDTIISCSKSHAVQNLDFRGIIYDSIEDSDFKPYLNALNISKQDLHLDGKMQNRQHEYVPAIRASLSMNLLCIIISFFLLCYTIYLVVVNKVMSHKKWALLCFLSMNSALFSGLGGTIISAMIQIIKGGTHDDAYGVVFDHNSSMLGLLWCGFTVAFLPFATIVLFWFNYWRQTKNGAVPTYNGSSSEEASVTSRITEHANNKSDEKESV